MADGEPGCAAARRPVEPHGRIVALSPGSALCRNRLISVIDAPSARPSLLNAGYSIAAPLSRFLQGIQIAAAPSADRFDEPVGADYNRTVEGFATLLRRDEIDSPALVLVGGPGAGRMRAAASLARTLAMPLRLLDLRATRREGIPIGKAIETIALEASLEKAIVCVSGIRAAIESEAGCPRNCTERSRPLPDALHRWSSSRPVVCPARSAGGPACARRRPLARRSRSAAACLVRAVGPRRIRIDGCGMPRSGGPFSLHPGAGCECGGNRARLADPGRRWVGRRVARPRRGTSPGPRATRSAGTD